MQIIKHQEQHLDVFEQGQKRLEQLANTPKVINLPEVELKTELSKTVFTAFQVAGQKSEAADIAFIILQIQADIQKYYNWITLGELKEVIERGVRGHYGSFYGLNVKTLNEWLIEYRDSPERKIYIQQKIAEKKQLQPPTLTPEQKEQDDRDFVNQYFYWVKEAWADGKPFKVYHMPPLIYPIMNRNKKIDLSDDEKSQIRDDAKRMYVEEREEFNLRFPDLKLDEAGMLDKIAKRLAVLKMFQRFIKQEFEKVF